VAYFILPQFEVEPRQSAQLLDACDT